MIPVRAALVVVLLRVVLEVDLVVAEVVVIPEAVALVVPVVGVLFLILMANLEDQLTRRQLRRSSVTSQL